MKRAAFLFVLLAVICPAASPKGPSKSIAVVDFENVTKDKTFDWLGTGIAEELITNLASIQGITLVERRELHGILKELKFNRSQYVDPATAQKIGKLLGADYMVLGGYQKFMDELRLTARLVEVETGKVFLPARVDGKFQDVLRLQNQLAEKLGKAIGASLGAEGGMSIETPPTSLEAYRLFSDGVYYFREGLIAEALENLDGALKLDPRFGLAHFYMGLALQKQGRWEEATGSFKQALPGADATPREKWIWEVPYEKPGSRREVSAVMRVGELKKPEKGKKKEEEEEIQFLPDTHHFIFGERIGKTSVLYLVDPLRRVVRRMVLPDPDVLHIGLFGVMGTESTAVLNSYTENMIDNSGNWKVYTIDTDEGILLWKWPFEGMVFPVGWNATAKTLYLQFASAGTFVALDLATGRVKWRRSDPYTAWYHVASDDVGPEGIVLARNHTLGSNAAMAVVRADDGKELWRIAGDVRDWANQLVGQTVLVMNCSTDSLRGYHALTGEKQFETSIPFRCRREGEGTPYESMHIPTSAKGETLYLAGKKKTIYAVTVGDKPGAAKRILWQTPIDDDPEFMRPFQDRLFVSHGNGKMTLLNRSTGKIVGHAKLGIDPVYPVYVRGPVGVFVSGRRLLGVDLQTLEKKWELRTEGSVPPSYMEGMLIFQSGKKELTAVDASTGEVLWRHLGAKSPVVIPGKNSVFVADITGVKEYISPKPANEHSLAKAEVLTQLALSLAELNRTEEAASFAQKVLKELDPDYPGAHYALARIHQQKNEPRKALRETVAYYQLLGPESSRAREVLSNLKQNFNLLWRTDAEWAYSMAPEETENLVVLHGQQDWFSALNLGTGVLDWRQKIDDVVATAISATSPKLYVVARASPESQTLQVWQVDVKSGEKKPLGSLDLPFKDEGFGQATLRHHLLLQLYGTEKSSGKRFWHLYRLDAPSGKVLWEYTKKLEVGEYISNVVDDEHNVLYALGKTLFVLSTDNGRQIGEHAEDVPINPLAASVSDPGRIYYVSSRRRLGAYDAQTNRLTWMFDVPEGETESPLKGDSVRGATLYQASPHEIFAVDLSENQSLKDRVRWRFILPESARFEQVRLMGDQIYCLRDDETLVRLDAESGKLVAEYPLLWDAEHFLVRGDTFYGLSADGHAYAMKLASLSGNIPTQATK